MPADVSPEFRRLSSGAPTRRSAGGTVRVSEAAQAGQVAHQIADDLLRGFRNVATEAEAPPSQPVGLDRDDPGSDRQRLEEALQATALGFRQTGALDRDRPAVAFDGEADACAALEPGSLQANARTMLFQRSMSAPGRKGR